MTFGGELCATVRKAALAVVLVALLADPAHGQVPVFAEDFESGLICTWSAVRSGAVCGLCGDCQFAVEEVCDDGNNASGDGCSGDCLSNETCGNGYLDWILGEVCDDGNTSGGDGCSADCSSTEDCSNGILDPGEVCDDGNNIDGDGCSANCLSEETCGNDIVDPVKGEECDDGDLNGEQGYCPSDCRWGFPLCGDWQTVDGEACDDGNRIDGDGCSHDCLSDETCGNGFADLILGEECDGPGETADCDPDCTLATCGDGTLNVTSGEICDDGNTESGDGCQAECLSDETCGNGFVDEAVGEQCDDGNTDPADGCDELCQLE